MTILRMGFSACNDLLKPGESIELSGGFKSPSVVVTKDADGVMRYLVDGQPGLPNTTHEPVNPDRGQPTNPFMPAECRVLFPVRRRGAA